MTTSPADHRSAGPLSALNPSPPTPTPTSSADAADNTRQLGGEELWAGIKRRAGVDVAAFVGMEPYPDDVTYRLVEAAAAELDIPSAAVLEAFGRHWILYTGRSGYGALFQTMGTTMPEFLGNLDAMHARVTLSMPELRPPSFLCETLDDGQLVLQYWSERDGLAPMVTGLLKGLAELFDLEASVTHTLDRASEADHHEFLITPVPAPPALDVVSP